MLDVKTLNLLKEEYAKVIVKVGLNIQKGAIVRFSATLDDIDFNRMIVKQCYLNHAKRVLIEYQDEQMNRIHYLYGDKDELSKVYDFQINRAKFELKNKVYNLHALTNDFEVMNGVNIKKVSEIIQSRQKCLMPFNAEFIFNCHWSCFALPSVSWAKKLFPHLKVEEGINKLWELIFKCCYIKKSNSVENFSKHVDELRKRANYLTSLNIKSLHYTNKLGTDLKINIIKGAKFIGGPHFISDTNFFVPNIPTEEIFTSPNYKGTNGIVYASKPVVIDGTLIKDFYFVFKNGKIVKVKAKENEKKLLQVVNTDIGSHYLGEAAFVPFSSQVNQTNTLFYDSLYDENAVSHLAFGTGFPIVLDRKLKKDAHKLGVNKSNTHIDFMVGTKDLNIVATTFDNKNITIFKNGTWDKDLFKNIK